MDPQTVALISGLLGGGVTGAIVGGLVTLWSQNRAFADANRHRFTNLKREQFSKFLTESDRRVTDRFQWELAAIEALRAGKPEPKREGVDDLLPLHRAAVEFSLMVREPKASAAADDMWRALSDLYATADALVIPFATRLPDIETIIQGFQKASAQARSAYETARDEFVTLVRKDLGVS